MISAAVRVLVAPGQRFVYNLILHNTCLKIKELTLAAQIPQKLDKKSSARTIKVYPRKEDVDMSYDFLAGRLRQLKMQQRDLARALAMSETSLSHRMNGQVAWRVDEMYDVLRIIGAAPAELPLYFPAA